MDDRTDGRPSDDIDDRRSRGLEMMRAVYGWDVADVPDDFVALTVDHLFGEIWTREGLSVRERRLLLLGLLVGTGQDDVVGLQIESSLGLDELTPAELREIVIFLTYYAGWPRGAKLNGLVERLIARHERSGRADDGPSTM